MRSASVLLVGRTGTKEDSGLKALQKRYGVAVASSGKQALLYLEAHRPDAIILDAASMRTPGERICRQIRERMPKTPILHIYPPDTPINAHGNESPADSAIHAPLTPRKLVNTIERLLKARTEHIIECGPFAMNVSRRVLVAYGQETQLTPKLALLVEVFLRNPNTTLERKTLMETIWKTDYLGDTRTLDVHIRWIRKALAGDGEHPHYLKTVRGIGYCLDVPNANGKTKSRF